MKVIATAVGALAVAWAVLLFGLGNVGLQRSVSIGAQVLVEDYLPITLAAAAVAFVVSLLGSAPARFEARDTIRLVGCAVVALVAMSWVIAPVLIGEFEIVHGAQVFLVLSVLGLVPAAIGLGGLLPAVWRGRRNADPPR
jgi:hypothetical protein